MAERLEINWIIRLNSDLNVADASAAYTLFAPNNDAFNKVYDPEGLLSNNSTLEGTSCREYAWQ